jgi:hypothetical protein
MRYGWWCRRVWSYATVLICNYRKVTAMFHVQKMLLTQKHFAKRYNSYSGTSIEIIDTDAEGRLVLADGISYMIKITNQNICRYRYTYR